MAGAVVIEPDSESIERLMALGGGDLKKCFQCANCVSVCSLSTTQHAFPRKQVLLMQWGQKEELLRDPGPWLCFYCGDCSKACPRQARPGETMMALRRYLTTQYDWTGLSGLMYSSPVWEIGILLAVAAAIVLLFTLPRGFGFGLLSRSGPGALSTVNLNSFAPAHIVHIGDTILAAVLSAFLLSNTARMFAKLTRGEKIPLRAYLRQLPYFALQGLTQIRWKDCKSRESATNWLRHLFLVTGYATMFTLVVLFLPWFQVEDTSFHWTSILGYYAAAVLMVATVWIIVDRIRKSEEMHRFSHLSDWLFPILLFLTAITGILVHAFRLMNMPMATYFTYMVHMAVAVPMLVVEVPFGKWAHLLYRPIAMFVAEVQQSRLHVPETVGVAASTVCSEG
jgi:quinone-modifying oxidoreductase, subunit QmoC